MEGRKVAKRMRRIYRAKNGVVEETEFWVSETAQPRRGKSKASTARKQEQNRNQAVHILTRKLNENFSQGDLFLTLTFSDRSWRALRSAAYGKMENYRRATKEQKRDAILFEAEREGKLMVRRLREAGAKDARYVLLGSDLDGRTKEEARVHLHLIISGDQCRQENKVMTICGKAPEEFWRFGTVSYEYLRSGSYARLAAYLIRQTRDIKNHKRYVCSRNLEAVDYEEFEVMPGTSPLQAPPGAKVEEYQHDPTNPYGMIYIRYTTELEKVLRRWR